MTKHGWMVVAVLFAAGAWSAPLRADETPLARAALDREEELSQTLRGRAVAALGVMRPEGVAWLAPGLENGLFQSMSGDAVLHGRLGRSFAHATWVLPTPVLPRNVALRSGPNPFHASADLAFDVPASGLVDLRIYDVAGREVRTLIHARWFDAGSYTETWDGRREDGGVVGAGVYFVRLQVVGREFSRRVVKL